MTEELHLAVHIATLEKAHRRAVEDVMQSDIGDVERIARILAMEAEHLGQMERLRSTWLQAAPAPAPDSKPKNNRNRHDDSIS